MADYSLCRLSALEIARRIRAGELSSAEATRATLAAIEQFNAPINAVVTVDVEGSIERAEAIDKRIAAGELDDSPLAGVPFLAKDLDVTAGMRTTFGSLMNKDYVPKWDMIHIARLKAAGCVLVGKTNTPEDGMIPNTYNPVFGPTRNPWNLERGPGGSSGGSAAAVAAGLAPLATGSDGGGSIRIPVAFSGCFGIKPTFGVIPFGPKGIGVINTLGHLGPITRTAADAAAMLDVMAGPEERDRASLACGPSALAAISGEFAPRRIAFSPDLGYANNDPDIRDAFEKSIAKLADAGWPLVEASPGFADPLDALKTIISFEWGTVPMLLEKDNPKAYAEQDEPVRRTAEARKKLTLETIWGANRVRKDLCMAMGRLFDDYDLLLTPATCRPAYEAEQPFPLRADGSGEIEEGFNAMIYPFNLTGDPACSMPMGLTRDGLPMGLQIVGPRHADARVLRAAHEAEGILGMGELRPPHGVTG